MTNSKIKVTVEQIIPLGHAHHNFVIYDPDDLDHHPCDVVYGVFWNRLAPGVVLEKFIYQQCNDLEYAREVAEITMKEDLNGLAEYGEIIYDPDNVDEAGAEEYYF